ncbi:MAG: metallophosphoesterase, partial [Acidobacteria bacterium]|nr:metallophosphoesterase [Acidobacteriota bacterium]
FAKEDLDGIVYQEVPQPGHPRYDSPRNAAEYGYTSGEIQGGAGHLRVLVTARTVTVDYVYSLLPASETTGRKNGQRGYSYAKAPF